MKKRIIYYIVLVAVVAGFFVLNYSSVQKCGDINIVSVTGGEHIVIVGELLGDFRSVRSVKSERIGNNFYIKVEAVNDFFSPEKTFKVTLPDKKNDIEKVFLADKDSAVTIYINSEFEKPKK